MDLQLERDCFFFQQTSFKQRQKRHKKQPEELPSDLRFAHLNPRIAAFLQNKEKENSCGDGFNDGLGNKSLLPQINQTVSQLRQQLDSLVSDLDTQRYKFEEEKLKADTLLAQLSKLLYYFEGTYPKIPNSLHYELMSEFKDLIINVQYVKRDWQLVANKEAYLQKLSDIDLLKRQEDRESRSDISIAGDEDYLKSGRETVGDTKASARSKSTTKLATSRTNTTLGDIDEKGEGKIKELKKPADSISAYSAGVKTGKSTTAMPGTPKEKRNTQTETPGAKRDRALSVRTGTRRIADDLASVVLESINAEKGSRSQAGRRESRDGHMGFYQVMSFQLSNTAMKEKGWLVQSDDPPVGRETILEWATQKLQEAIAKKRDEKAEEVELGWDRPPSIRYYGDSKKHQMEQYKRSLSSGTITNRTNPVWRGEKPRIPPTILKVKGKSTFIATTTDGSTTVFYPNGRPAIVTSRSGSNKPGFYTSVFENNLDSTMLASFTPSGVGTVYHPDTGNIAFFCSAEGGSLADPAGSVTRRWVWPTEPHTKLQTSVIVQVNAHIILRCTSHSRMELSFTAGKETAKLNVGVMEEKEPTREELGHLLTSYQFLSRTASDFKQPYKPAKSKSKHKMKAKSKTMMEIQKILDFPEPTENDASADKELYRLERKVKQLADTWMEHYRIAVGIASPLIHAMQDKPGPKRGKSALPGGGRVVIEMPATSVPKPSRVVRAPSAPPARPKPRPLSVLVPKSSQRPVSAQQPAKATESRVMFDDNPPEEIEISDYDSGVGRRSTGLSSAGSVRSQSAVYSRPYSGVSGPGSLEEWKRQLGMCPVALRALLLGDSLEGQTLTCKCSRHRIPFITDIEYDDLIIRYSPPRQLIVVGVTSTMYADSQPAAEMLEKLHTDAARNRCRPCLAARSDATRVLWYDTATAAHSTDHMTPLLLRRHNVVPGMFLMYQGGRLLFCDHIFNGYGNAKKDFQKQIAASQRMADEGHSMPHDFKFSSATSLKLPPVRVISSSVGMMPKMPKRHKTSWGRLLSQIY